VLTTTRFSPTSCAPWDAIATPCAKRSRRCEASGGHFADLADARAEATAMAYLKKGGGVVTALGRAVLQCYYRDDRVIRSLGLEPRAPFPKGHVLEPGDWSLLDAVRSRPRMWRDLDGKGA
jgi:hypothetical protein